MSDQNLYPHNLFFHEGFFVRLCPGWSSGFPAFTCLPSRFDKWLLKGKSFYPGLPGIRITAAGPLPYFTGFPFPPGVLAKAKSPL